MIARNSLSAQLIGGLKSLILWRALLSAAVFYHVFTWSSPFPSDVEANLYIEGLRGGSEGLFWTVLIRAINFIFSFSYAKFAFVLIGLGCSTIVYSVFRRVAGEWMALVTALMICCNSFIFSPWHRTQPEIVVLFLFLSSVYFFIRFSSYWHLDLKKSSNISVAAVFILSLAIINTDYSAVAFVPAMFLMVFLIFYRVYTLCVALIATAVIIFLVFASQAFISLSYFQIVFERLVISPRTGPSLPLFSALTMTYINGYASLVWNELYPSFDFLNLSTASLRSRELVSLLAITLVAGVLFVIKMLRFFSRGRARLEFRAICYGPHMPLVLIISVAFGFSAFLEVCSNGSSITYLVYAVFLSILLCASIYSFFSFSERGSIAATLGVRLAELIYKPVAIVACCVMFFLGLANSIFYVVPYRASNYPTTYDALEQFWKGSNCSRVAYGVPVLNAALNISQKSPPKTLNELFGEIREGRRLDEGCIVYPLIARDGVYQYAAQHDLRTKVDEVLHEKFLQEARLVLPFYQKDMAYPFTSVNGDSVSADLYRHAHGHPLYGFGGMQDVIIYRPLSIDTSRR